jgi:hypothetical protein
VDQILITDFIILICAATIGITLHREIQNYYKILLVIAIVPSSVIVNKAYAGVDEILLLIIVFSLLIHLLFKRTISSLFNNKSLHAPENILLLYLFLNSVISIFSNNGTSSLRFILLFLNLLVLNMARDSVKSNSDGIGKIVSISFFVYLSGWLLHFYLLKFLKIDWISNQSITWSGTSFAAFPVALGLLFLLIKFSEDQLGSSRNLFFAYFTLTLLASQLYYSRVLFIITGLAILLFFLKSLVLDKLPRILLNFAVVGILSFIVLFVGNVSVPGSALGSSKIESSDGINAVVTKTTDLVLAQAISAKASANFIVDPKTRDIDRQMQLFCAFSVVSNADHVINRIFGFGQNRHKTELLSCPEIQQFLREGQNEFRPVGYSAYLVDYGFFGAAILFLIFILNLVRITRSVSKNKLWLVFYFVAACWPLLSNINDEVILYLVLFMRFDQSFTSNPSSDRRAKKL